MSKWRVPVCWWTALLLGAVISLSIYAQQDQEKNPKSTSVQEAIRLYEQARFLEAREAAQNALKSELPLKEQIALRELLAFVAVATDEHHLAQSYFVEILKHNPDYKPVKESPKIQRVFEAARLRLRLEQARDAYRKGDLENLGSFAKAALQAELTPAEQVEALWYVAYYQVALGDEQGATRTFKEILKLKPDFKVSPDASPKLHRVVQTVTTPVLSGKKGGGGGAGAAIGALAVLGGLAAALGKGGGGGGGGTPLPPPTGTVAGYVYQGSLFIVPSPSDAPFPSQPVANAIVGTGGLVYYTDTTGYFALTVAVGTHTLWVTAGGETLRQTIVVREGYQVLGPINVPPSGTLNINSSPSGARIFIDGIDTGKVTPTTLKVITGSHQVTLTKSGYRDEIFNILVSSGSTQTVNKTLQPTTTNRPPNKPANQQPANGAVINTLTPTLRASSFSDSDGDSHKASQWRIREQDSTSYVWDSGEDRTNKTSIAVPSGRLQWGKTYLWQVRYQDEHGSWSEWSDETSFHTNPLTLQWSFATGSSIMSSPIYGDIDGDGKLEVVVGSDDNKVYAINGENGSKLWEFETGAYVTSSPALGDIDGDGKLEVVVGSYDSDSKVYAINGEDGSKLWEFATGYRVFSSPALGDIDGDGKLEVVVGSSDNKVYAINGEDGSKLWEFPTGGAVLSSPALGDIDGDGRLEVVVGSDDNKVYAINGEDGSKLWEFATGYRVFSSPALGDIDGDGKLEVVVGSGDYKVYAINGENGSKLWEFATGDYVVSSPALGDIDGDGKLEVVVGSYDNKVYCLDLGEGSYNPNLLPWPMFHHDPNRTGLYEPPPTRLRLVKERHKDLGWSFTVIAMAQDRQRAEVVLGVATSLDEAKRMSEVFPPNRQIASLQLLAIQASERGEAKTYRSLYRHGLSKQEWQLVLICPHENGEVVLTWGDLSQVPKQYRLYLIDELTGKRIYMRTSSSYKVEQGTRDRGQGLERRFLVIADPTPSGKLQVFVNEVVPMRGGGWLIGYTVTKPAKVLGEVRTLTGRLVKQLPTSEQVKAGRGNLVWDGRSADGSLLPKGVYLVKLVAMTDEGEQVQAVRTIFVR